MLHADEMWHATTIKALKKRHVLEDLAGQHAALQKDWENAVQDVYKYEFDLITLQSERIKVSPRAVEQGWVQELDETSGQHRGWLTSAKAKALFQIARPLRAAADQLEADALGVADLEYQHKLLQEQYTVERHALDSREKHRRLAEKALNEQAAVGVQRRRWKVKWYTDAGKPDVRRRAQLQRKGHGAEGTAEGDGGDGSVLAQDIDEEDAMFLEESKTRQAGVTSNMESQIAHRELVQYGALLKPMFESMETVTVRGFNAVLFCCVSLRRR